MGGQAICVSLVESLLAVFSLATVVNLAKARMLMEDLCQHCTISPRY